MESFYIRPKVEYCTKGIYEFTKTVELDNETVFDINVFTSGRYILYVNDKCICEGPCRTSEGRAYFDSVTNVQFKKGKNEICLRLMHLTEPFSFSSLFKSNIPQVLFSAKNIEMEIISDKSWECRLKKNHGLVNSGFVPPSENIVLPEEYEDIEITEKFSFDFDIGYHSDWGVLNGYELSERPIPMIYPGEEITFLPVKKGDGFIEFDAGKYVTARIYADIAKNSSVKILYSECYEFEDGKKDRADTSGFLKGAYDVIQTSDADYRFESYWFKAFRFIRVEAENVEQALLSLSARRLGYPLDIQGKFASSDTYLNKMYDISVNTLLCCMHEIFVDCPHYEQQQYIMDAAIEAAAVMCMSDDTRLVKKCIQEFAASQQPSGYLSANYPRTVCQIIPGFSFFWVFLLRDYLEWSKDAVFTKTMVPTLDKVLSLFDSNLSEEGLVKRNHYWDFVDWVDGWERGVPLLECEKPSTIYSMYYACTLNYAAEICERVGRCGLASEYKKRYTAVCGSIKKHCYDEERGMFSLAPDEKVFSQHTIIWSILAEIVTGDEAKEQVSHLFDTGVSPASFSMNYYLFRALEKCGCYDDYAFKIIKQWNDMIDNNCTTWCESTEATPRSECHAWSSAPLYEIARNILGVKVSFKDEIEIVPKTYCLPHARGTVSTRFGEVKVSWKNENDGCVLEVTAPENVKKILRLPNGEKVEFVESIKIIKI